MDAITLLKTDHKNVETLFKRFEKAGDKAYVEKREIVDKIIEALSKHAAVEEQLFYPVSRATVPETDDVVLESLEEHHVVKWLLSELDGMPPQHERFDAKVTVLIENVRHHVEEEEQEFFPKVRDELGREALADLGDAMAAAEVIAPTHPHPRSPDTPPGNLVAGTAAGVVDRVGDTVSGLTQGGVAAVQDLVATILRRPRPQTSSRGTTTARRTAGRVRSTAESITDDAIEAVRDAKRSSQRVVKRSTAKARRSGSTGAAGAKRVAKTAKTGAAKTARAAKSGAKGTATSARTSAKRTTATAKRASTTTGRTAKTAVRTTRAAATRATRSTTKAAKRGSRAR